MYPTGFKSNQEFLTSDKLYVKRARLVLPILVRQAKAGSYIYYSDLAREVGMPNPRNLNWVLGAIGNAILTLEAKLQNGKIPLINCIVLNQSTQLPGEGIDFFISKVNFGKLNTIQKKDTLNQILAEIYTYPYWDIVLMELNLEPLTTDFENKFETEIEKINHRAGFGEGRSHLDFKNYLALNPSKLNLKPGYIASIEFAFPSGDSIDIMFENKKEMVVLRSNLRSQTLQTY